MTNHTLCALRLPYYFCRSEICIFRQMVHAIIEMQDMKHALRFNLKSIKPQGTKVQI